MYQIDTSLVLLTFSNLTHCAATQYIPKALVLKLYHVSSVLPTLHLQDNWSLCSNFDHYFVEGYLQVPEHVRCGPGGI